MVLHVSCCVVSCRDDDDVDASVGDAMMMVMVVGSSLLWSDHTRPCFLEFGTYSIKPSGYRFIFCR